MKDRTDVVADFHLPEEGVIEAMGVAMMLLGLRAANCCICTAATVATGDKYADWATKACCWTSWLWQKEKKNSESRTMTYKTFSRVLCRGCTRVIRSMPFQLELPVCRTESNYGSISGNKPNTTSSYCFNPNSIHPILWTKSWYIRWPWNFWHLSHILCIKKVNALDNKTPNQVEFSLKTDTVQKFC